MNYIEQLNRKKNSAGLVSGRLKINEYDTIDENVSAHINPKNWDISFDYESCSFWHKSSPSGHIPNIRTKELSAEQIVEYRNQIEQRFKKKGLLR